MAMTIDLNGRVALVTGGGRGIGAALAEALAAAGATVAVTSRNATELRKVVEEMHRCSGKAQAYPRDLAGEGAIGLVEEVVHDHGGLHVLVHAAGNQVRKPTLDFTLADWDSIFDLHLRSGFILAQAAVRVMLDQPERGSIIFIGSMTSERLGHPGTVAYNAAKAGVLGLARTFAVEFGVNGIRTNTVLPGFVHSAMAAEVSASPERKALTSRVPIGRYGIPEELGGLVVFLASESAGYITGEAIAVDGGWSVA